MGADPKGGGLATQRRRAAPHHECHDLEALSGGTALLAAPVYADRKQPHWKPRPAKAAKVPTPTVLVVASELGQP